MTEPGSSIESGEARDIEEAGIDLKLVQSTFIGITADTSSDEEQVPAALIQAVGLAVEESPDYGGDEPDPWNAPDPLADLPSWVKNQPYVADADPWKFDEHETRSAGPTSDFLGEKIPSSFRTTCCERCIVCMERPCALSPRHFIEGVNDSIAFTCRFALHGLDCSLKEHLPKYEGFDGKGQFIGKERDLADFLDTHVFLSSDEDDAKEEPGEMPRYLPTAPLY